MATNRPNGGGRRGAIRNRMQFQLPNGRYAKIDRQTGRILAIKADGTPWKGVIVTEAPAVLPRRPGPRQALPRFGAPRRRVADTTPRVIPFERIEDARVAA